MECPGNGSCLQQTDEDAYQLDENCKYKCQSLKCHNYIICNETFPKWVGDCHRGFCMNCAAIFGCHVEVLTVDMEECPICFEHTDTMAKFPQCTHHVCISCYKRFYYDDNDDSDDGSCVYIQRPQSCPFCRGDIEHIKWWETKRNLRK